MLSAKPCTLVSPDNQNTAAIEKRASSAIALYGMRSSVSLASRSRRAMRSPAVRRVVVATVVVAVSLWAAHQGEGALEDIDLVQPECALVVRPALDVGVLRCDAGTLAFVGRAHAGGDLADCTAAGAAHPGFFLSATLALLLAHGALSALSFPEENPT